MNDGSQPEAAGHLDHHTFRQTYRCISTKLRLLYRYISTPHLINDLPDAFQWLQVKPKLHLAHVFHDERKWQCWAIVGHVVALVFHGPVGMAQHDGNQVSLQLGSSQCLVEIGAQ